MNEIDEKNLLPGAAIFTDFLDKLAKVVKADRVENYTTEMQGY